MFYLTTHSTHMYLRVYGRKEGNILFNDALNIYIFIFTDIRKEGNFFI